MTVDSESLCLVAWPNIVTPQEVYKRKAQIIKALGHPSRLMMIDALAEGEKCVCELQQLVGADMSTVLSLIHI